MEHFRELRRGERRTVAEDNRLAETVVELYERTEGVTEEAEAARRDVQLGRSFVAVITGKLLLGPGTYAYAWSRLEQDPSYGQYGVLSTDPAGFAGTTTFWPAFESSGNPNVPTDAVVRMWAVPNGECFWFEYPAAVSGPSGPSQPGIVGLDGEPGEDAYPIPGPQGPPGPAGGTGPQGPIGIGLDGDQGEDAYPIPGPAGLQGIPGVSNAVGPQGMEGEPAEDTYPVPGQQGQQGVAGVSNVPGPMGAPGMDGEPSEDPTYYLLSTPAAVVTPPSGYPPCLKRLMAGAFR